MRPSGRQREDLGAGCRGVAGEGGGGEGERECMAYHALVLIFFYSGCLSVYSSPYFSFFF